MCRDKISCRLAIESRSAISHGSRPFTDKGPLVGTRVCVGIVANILPVLPWLHCDKFVGEALVFVVVDCDVHGIVVGRSQPAVVGTGILKPILDNSNTAVRVSSLLVESVALVGLDVVKVELAGQRLVDKLDSCDHVVVR